MVTPTTSSSALSSQSQPPIHVCVYCKQLGIHRNLNIHDSKPRAISAGRFYSSKWSDHVWKHIKIEILPNNPEYLESWGTPTDNLSQKQLEEEIFKIVAAKCFPQLVPAYTPVNTQNSNEVARETQTGTSNPSFVNRISPENQEAGTSRSTVSNLTDNSFKASQSVPNQSVLQTPSFHSPTVANNRASCSGESYSNCSAQQPPKLLMESENVNRAKANNADDCTVIEVAKKDIDLICLSSDEEDEGQTSSVQSSVNQNSMASKPVPILRAENDPLAKIKVESTQLLPLNEGSTLFERFRYLDSSLNQNQTNDNIPSIGQNQTNDNIPSIGQNQTNDSTPRIDSSSRLQSSTNNCSTANIPSISSASRSHANPSATGSAINSGAETSAIIENGGELTENPMTVKGKKIISWADPHASVKYLDMNDFTTVVGESQASSVMVQLHPPSNRGRRAGSKSGRASSVSMSLSPSATSSSLKEPEMPVVTKKARKSGGRKKAVLEPRPGSKSGSSNGPPSRPKKPKRKRLPPNEVLCKLCEVSIPRIYKKEHIFVTHIQKPAVECPICGFSDFFSFDVIRDHMKQEHPDDEDTKNETIRDNFYALNDEVQQFTIDCFG